MAAAEYIDKPSKHLRRPLMSPNKEDLHVPQRHQISTGESSSDSVRSCRAPRTRASLAGSLCTGDDQVKQRASKSSRTTPGPADEIQRKAKTALPVDGWMRAKPKRVGCSRPLSAGAGASGHSLVFGRRPWMDQQESRRGEGRRGG